MTIEEADRFLRATATPIAAIFACPRTLLFWDAHRRFQIAVFEPEEGALAVAGSKPYFLAGATDDLWARDVGPFLDFLEGWPRFALRFEYVRDLPEALAVRRATDAGILPPGWMDLPRQHAAADGAAAGAQESLERNEQLIRAYDGRDEVAAYLRQKSSALQADATRLREERAALTRKREYADALVRAYRRSGRGAVVIFDYVSDSIPVHDAAGLGAALETIAREIARVHAYEIAQKFGGALHIEVREVDDPALALTFAWCGR